MRQELSGTFVGWLAGAVGIRQDWSGCVRLLVVCGGMWFVAGTGDWAGAAPIDEGGTGVSAETGELKTEAEPDLRLGGLKDLSVTPNVADADKGLAADALSSERGDTNTKLRVVEAGVADVRDVGGVGGVGGGKLGDLSVFRPPFENEEAGVLIVREDAEKLVRDTDMEQNAADSPQEYFVLSEDERKILYEDFQKDLFGTNSEATPVLLFVWLSLLAAVPVLLLLALLFLKYRALGLSRPRWMMSKAEFDQERYGDY